MNTSARFRRWAERCTAHAVKILPAPRSDWGEAMRHELDHIESDTEAFRWAAGCVFAAYSQRLQEEFRCFASMLKRPSAFLPLAMSFAALAIVLVQLAWFGPAGQRDEGTAAHLWQLLMAAQLPVIATFAIKWLRRSTKGAWYVLAAQSAGGLAAAAPVFLLHW